jgi:hypothetical protein
MPTRHSDSGITKDQLTTVSVPWVYEWIDPELPDSADLVFAFLSKLLEANVDVRFADLPQIEGPSLQAPRSRRLSRNDRLCRGLCKSKIAFSENFSSPGGTGLTSIRVPLFDVGRAVSTNISRSTVLHSASSRHAFSNSGSLNVCFHGAQLASVHMRRSSPPTRSGNLLKYQHVLRCRCCRSPIQPPNSTDLERAGMKFQINANRWSGAVAL